MTRRALALVVLLVVTCLPAPVGAQAGDDAFKEGLDARKKGDWAAAAAAMRRAIQTDGQESQRKVDKTLFFGGTEYLPHFFLGEALFRQGDCARAVVNWGRSDSQGVVHRVREYSEDLRNGMADCKQKGVLLPGEFEAARTNAHQLITEASALAKKVQNRGSEQLDVWRGQAGFDDRYEQARGDIEEARTKLQAVDTSRRAADFGEIELLIGQARATLTSLSSEFESAVARRRAARSLADEVQQMVGAAEALDRQIEDKRQWLTPTLTASRNDAAKTLSAARSHVAARTPSESDLRADRSAVAGATQTLEQVLAEAMEIERKVNSQRFGRKYAPVGEAFTAIENQLDTLESLMTSRPTKVTEDMPAQLDTLRKEFGTASRRLEAARRAEQESGLVAATATAERLKPQLQELLAGFGPLTLAEQGVPMWLQNGASSYLNGEYARALAELDLSNGGDLRVPLHVHLFRAASHYALYLRSGEKDETHRTQALAEIARCNEKNPDFEPDGRVFSKRFIDFYNAQR